MSILFEGTAEGKPGKYCIIKSIQVLEQAVPWQLTTKIFIFLEEKTKEIG